MSRSLLSRTGTSPEFSVRFPARPVAGRDPQHAQGCRGDAGLTTLEWLLIVAAVAGLAALAVVLVQNVVGDTGEQISGSNARATAARVAGDQVNRDALAEGNSAAVDLSIAAVLADTNAKYSRECRKLGIIYADAGITADYDPGSNTAANWDPADEPVCTLSTSGIAAPGAPTNVAYNAVTGILSWTAPTGPVTSYTVTCAGNATGSACPVGFTGYTGPLRTRTVGPPDPAAVMGSAAVFSVTATNSGGTSAAGTDTHMVP